MFLGEMIAKVQKQITHLSATGNTSESLNSNLLQIQKKTAKEAFCFCSERENLPIGRASRLL